MATSLAIEQLASGLDDAVENGHLPNPNAPVLQNQQNETDSAAYVKAVRIRLKALGYQRQSSSRNAGVDTGFISAVKRFQSAVGLVEDGWSGPLTWKVLDSLYSYENDQDPTIWLEGWTHAQLIESDLLTNDAVRRAVYLRLYSMGFFGFSENHQNRLTLRSDVDPVSNPAFQQALQLFVGFCRTLGLADLHPDDGLNMPLLSLVFGFDRLVKAVAETDSYAGLQRQFKPQLRAITRIELWLSGYDISPGPDV